MDDSRRISELPCLRAEGGGGLSREVRPHETAERRRMIGEWIHRGTRCMNSAAVMSGTSAEKRANCLFIRGVRHIVVA